MNEHEPSHVAGVRTANAACCISQIAS